LIKLSSYLKASNDRSLIVNKCLKPFQEHKPVLSNEGKVWYLLLDHVEMDQKDHNYLPDFLSNSLVK